MRETLTVCSGSQLSDLRDLLEGAGIEYELNKLDGKQRFDRAVMGVETRFGKADEDSYQVNVASADLDKARAVLGNHLAELERALEQEAGPATPESKAEDAAWYEKREKRARRWLRAGLGLIIGVVAVALFAGVIGLRGTRHLSAADTVDRFRRYGAADCEADLCTIEMTSPEIRIISLVDGKMYPALFTFGERWVAPIYVERGTEGQIPTRVTGRAAQLRSLEKHAALQAYYTSNFECGARLLGEQPHKCETHELAKLWVFVAE